MLETAAGPGIGSLADLAGLMLKARDAGLSEDEKFRFSELFNWATQNTPWVNLFYVRPALDFLMLHSLREVASPGASRREDEQRRRQYSQQRWTPKPLDPFGGFR
ncbi:hypothetical protein EN780_14795 [Mesorhizobium sp. M4B.F.Ca.ET.089.01.1.1]|uniref:hypothetical protein n=1 Tax=Mesorhizobium sp. M4B.F.Ca.ET.089.01.1.1 TaxID=2496662 RepID=UPI000FE3B3C7|nr:hypothetical protein [Mesorhizobium sp. M4B.F.Ca.ET.089.01.1.1]RWX66565.1 hypothetical protein EN780_14795 [Mesorhizobium sp. M4B.F.Ca.ET.089.01.1.1]